jgi:hypothetical protein
MSCLGVLFSLDKMEVDKFKSFSTDEEKLDYLQEEIEKIYFEQKPEHVAELDKSWDALHRSLTDGKLEYTNGQFPFNHVILGGEILYTAGDYILTLKTPEQVKEIAIAIEQLEKNALRDGYRKIDEDDYGSPLTEEDFEYTWEWMERTKDFWTTAAANNRHVLFTVDQ